MPDLKAVIFSDLERELAVTRKVLAAAPAEHFTWKPHEKSMSLGQLSIHVATLPEWMKDSLAQDVLDVATAPRPPKTVADSAELLALFDDRSAALRAVVERFDAGTWDAQWTMTNGEQVFTAQRRSKVFRVWCMNHMVHHRGQLCLYLRMLNVKVPTVYFNTAEEPEFVFE